jgi:hypothetical protein
MNLFVSPTRSSLVLFFVAIAAGALLSAVLALALLREARLRRALEALLRRILMIWRRLRSPDESQTPRRGPDDSDCDERV